MVGAARHASQTRRHGHQHFVAGGMTLAVIDAFEAVQIDEGQRETAAMTAGMGGGGIQRADESGAVGKPGQAHRSRRAIRRRARCLCAGWRSRWSV